VATAGSADQPESGADFRAKFEALQAENQALTQVSRNLAASAYAHVKPEDFEGIDPAKYVEHAAQVHNARVQEREQLWSELAREKGIDPSALSQGNAAAKPQDATQLRLASVGELRGTPPAPRDPTEGLKGQAALAAYYAAQEG
jgi:hypothetical protein